MFENDSLGPEILSNPSVTQYLFIKELEARIGGYHSIADANNSFSYLGEFGSSLTAQCMRSASSTFNALYPVRAQTPADLSGWISDYDIFNLQAAPASVGMRMLIPTDWIKQAAVAYNSTYNVILIPNTTVFKFASKSWALYYPIQILYNPTTGNITADYDTSTIDDLSPEATNILDDVHLEIHDGKTYLSISFEVYQFYRTLYQEKSVTAVTGFNQVFPYPNYFYAVKVSTYVNGAWSELNYTLSESIYDVTDATALVTVDNDNGQLTVRIPQVYFTNGLIGSIVNVEILTTEGEVSFAITDTDSANVQADFNPGSSTYSAMLATNKGSFILPQVGVTAVTGGANPMSFATLRQSVIRDALHTQAPISNLQLSVAVAKYGYTLTQYLDNVTDRVYYASSPVSVGTTGRFLPVVVSPVVFDMSKTIPSTVITHGDGSMTIMPNTIFDYNATTGKATVVDDDTLAAMATMSRAQLAAKLNSVIYTRQPYHIWFYANANAPQAKTYNLLSPSVQSLYVTGENNSSLVLSSVTKIGITHDNDGTGGYTFTFYSRRMTSVTNDNLAGTTVLAQIIDRSANVLNVVALYVGTDQTTGLDIYQFHLGTNYQITIDGYLMCTLPLYDGTTRTAELPLTLSVNIVTLVDNSQIGTATVDTSLNSGVPATYLASSMVISTQTAVVVLGEDMSSILSNNVITTWGDPVYATWEVDVPYTYAANQYLTDGERKLVVDLSGTTPTLVKIASAGDPIPAGTDLNITVSVAASLGDESITVADATGVTRNGLLRGLNFSSGTYVSEINGNVLSLSQPLLGDIPIDTVVQVKSTYFQTTVTAAAASGTNVLETDTTNIANGLTIIGAAIPAGTTVTVSSGKLTLSNNLTAAMSAGDPIALLDPNAPLAYRYRKGDIKRDSMGNPVVSVPAANIFTVTVTQFDERLFRSEQTADQTFAASLPAWMSAAAHGLDPVRLTLLEETYLYYRPYRTMGNASFTAGDGVVVQLPLGMSFSITYYVSSADKANLSKQQLIISSTLNVVNSYLQLGTISTVELASTLKSTFAGMVLDIDISAIDNGTNNTVAIATAGALPTPAYSLSVADDGRLAYTPDIDITFETAPVSVIQSTQSTNTTV